MIEKKFDLVALGDCNADVSACLTSYPLSGGCTFGERAGVLPGGTAVNTAIAAARLGLKVAVITAVGRDEYGKAIRKLLQSEGVETEFIKEADEPTGNVFIAIEPSGEHTFFCLRLHCADWQLEESDIPLDVVVRSRAVYASGVAVAEAGIVKPSAYAVMAALRHAREAGVLTFFDPNLRMDTPQITPEIARVMGACIRNTDFYLPNKSESDILVSSDPDAPASGLRGTVIKQGAHGCTVMGSSREKHIPAIHVQAADTTGAGDSFNAGFVAGFLSTGHIESAAKLGSIVAGITVSRVGTVSAFPRESDIRNYAWDVS
jgi:sugar/nucleoside kinase (ribokinase family)